MKLLPNYSLRQILIAMIGVAMVMACLASASRGSLIGMCLIASVVSLSIPLVSLALVYWAAYFFRRLIDAAKGRSLLVLGMLICPLNPLNYWAVNSVAVAQQKMPAGKSGYIVTIEDRFPITDFGFLNMRVKMEKSSGKPARQQEVFTVVVASQYQYPANRIVATLVIEAGDVSGEVELAVPQASTQFSYLGLSIRRGIDDSVPNRRDLFNTYIHSSSGVVNSTILDSGTVWVTSICPKNVGTTFAVWDQNATSVPTTTDVGSAGDDAKSIFAAVDVFDITTKNLGTSVVTVREAGPIHPANLPSAWIGISGIRMIFITQDELQGMARNQLAKLMVLENWVAAGGTLVVFDLDGQLDLGRPQPKTEQDPGSGWKRALEIMPTLLSDRKEILDRWQDQWWKLKPEALRIKTEKGTIDRIDGVVAKQRWLAADPAKDGELNAPFLLQRHVLGRVIAVPGHFEGWAAKEWNLLGEAIICAGGTHPASDADASCDSRLSIPGVGKPPLKAFQILMCLFVIAAGPGVYSILKRTEQMQLFFFVVPILALTSCFGLLSYVVLIEGFGSYGRTQTVTWVDHSQTAVTQARSMYYHGLTPAPYLQGSQTLPLEFNSGTNLKLLHEGGEILVSGGNIQPRVPHRFVNLKSGRMEKKMRLEPMKVADASGKSSPDYRIFNGLGNEVAAVVFRTETGWFFGEKVRDGQTVVAQPIDPLTAHQRLSDLVNEFAPLDHPMMGLTERNIRTESGLIEELRNTEFSPVKLADWMTPGTYVAILNDFSEVESMLQRVEFKYRLHVVVGQW